MYIIGVLLSLLLVGLLFAYGITNSGKTYTMSGEPDQPGILPRIMDVLFNTIADVQTPKCVCSQCTCTCIQEILYYTQMYDCKCSNHMYMCMFQFIKGSHSFQREYISVLFCLFYLLPTHVVV